MLFNLVFTGIIWCLVNMQYVTQEVWDGAILKHSQVMLVLLVHLD